MEHVKNIREVIAHFDVNPDLNSLRAYGSGHINDTYFLKNIERKGNDYLLQRINHHVFKNVERLTENMRVVINHLKNKVRAAGIGNPEKEVMTLIPTKSGEYFYLDDRSNYWRMTYFLNDTKTYDVVETEKQAYEGGKAFGKFQAMLSDLPAGFIYDVIPDFHNVETRLSQLVDAVHHNLYGRVKSVTAELEIIKEYAASMSYFQQEEQLLSLPRRVIHNDTKFNNVLLNLKDEAQCVIDLDTVMDGYVAYDFGDAIRTIVNTTVEDEKDLSKIQLNLPLFGAYTKGYLQEAGKFITDDEVDSLLKGVLLLPYMQGVRFLTDYINGDQYFKIQFDEHNLQRTKAQLQLLKMLDTRSGILQHTILTEMNVYK